MFRIMLAFIAVLLSAGFVHAQDWPEFRGPSGQGIVAAGKLPTEWTATKNVVWKQPIPGLGWSSPVIWQGKIYLTTAVQAEGKPDYSLRTLCLDAQTGKILWDTEIFQQDGKTAPKIHSKNSHASPTPIVDGQRVYVHFGHQGTAALDLNGKILWKTTELKYSPVHGNGGAPILVDNALIFSCDGASKPFVAALDKATGKTLWQTERKTGSGKKFAFSTPALITVNGQKQVVSPGAGAVCAYDPATGKELWRVDYGQGYSLIPKPVFGNGLVFVTTGYDSAGLRAIRPDGSGDVTKSHVAWSLDKAVSLTPSLLLVGDELYMVSDNGIASCLNAKTGEVHWQERIPGNYSASPMLANGLIYFQNEQGLGTVVKAGTKFEVVAKNNLGERTLASYAASNGALFIRTDKNLYRIEEK